MRIFLRVLFFLCLFFLAWPIMTKPPFVFSRTVDPFILTVGIWFIANWLCNAIEAWHRDITFVFILCCLLPSCGFMDQNGMPHQMGGQLAVERWPDGHYKYVGDFNDSFKVAADDVTQLITMLGASVIAGDTAKTIQLTQQLKDKGVSDQAIATIKANAATQQGANGLNAGVTGKAIDGGLFTPAATTFKQPTIH